MSAIVGIDEVVIPSGREVLASVDARTLALVHGRRSRDILRRGWLVRRALLLADVLGLTAAFFLAGALFGPESSVDRVSNLQEVLLFLGALPVLVVLAKVYGLYERDEERTDHSTLDDVVGVFHLVTVFVWVFYLAINATTIAEPPLSRVVAFWMLAVLLVTSGRAVGRAAVR